MTTTLRGLLGLGLCATLSLAGCGSGDDSSTGSTRTPAPTRTAGPSATPELDAIGVIGHSGATGADSAGDGLDVPANSWATGENPVVDSVYLRLLAGHPALEGHNWNEAISGSDVTSLMGQAEALMGHDPVPDVVLVQSIDNDIRCDGTDEQNYGPFEDAIREVVDYLRQASPAVKIFFVDQWAAVQTYDDVLASVPHGIDHITDEGPCAAYTADGTRHPDRERYLEQVVASYFQRIEQVCGAVPDCATDGGALRRFDLEPQDLTPDLNHLMPSGQAKMAAIVWDRLPSAWK